MGTYQEMQDRIGLDYLNRTDMNEQVKRAIKNTIKNYESRRYWFNETATTTTTTANIATFGVPSDFLALDFIRLTYSGSTEKLHRDTFDGILQMNATSAIGCPTHFAERGDNFHLSLIPDSANSVTTYYLQRLPELSAGSDTNAWMDEASNVIAHAATIEMLTAVLHAADPERIQFHVGMLGQATLELNLRNTIRLTHKLKATKF